ncbi:Glycoside hydrolase, family GH99 [Flavobacterium sp. 9AF]|uniref:glycoside hydrolase family 71/99-like protein n=1 Tax=Flavobacterium sp. 9AF TaxID=2653142 RepID=UPI0012F108CE|nr:glycoside hydrolase family 71/99-like protein [Flavobacterium sp. 9AF]VXC19138.1 Glycoside hydrolase, family GH99 [Flavobacterium sp. 9AF]
MNAKLKLYIIVILSLIAIKCSNDAEYDHIVIEPTISAEELLDKAYNEMINQKGKPLPVDVVKSNVKKVYVHYMPWFYSLEKDGYWGQHWTMTNRNPNNMDSNGKREIASHYYPLIGPYSSNDDDLQEYHLLLMKLSGIDGVIFDWYGSRSVNDYAQLKTSTESFINEIEEVGLKFAIMYEDKTTQYMQTQRVSSSSIAAAANDLQYIQNTYFTSPNYIRINNSELLFLFGPNYITDPLDWQLIMAQLNSTPTFMSLWAASNRLGQYAGGEYSWIDSNHLTTLSNYYQYAFQNNIPTVGGVYSGFNDYYYEGGWRTTTDQDWVIPHNGTQVLEQTLNLTDSYPVEFIQLLTWNDFGEGTMMEPTNEFGYSFLEKIQAYTGVTYTVEDLQLPYRLYLLRKKYKNDNRLQTILDRAYQFIFTLDLNNAKNLLTTIETQYGT